MMLLINIIIPEAYESRIGAWASKQSNDLNR